MVLVNVAPSVGSVSAANAGGNMGLPRCRLAPPCGLSDDVAEPDLLVQESADYCGQQSAVLISGQKSFDCLLVKKSFFGAASRI